MTALRLCGLALVMGSGCSPATPDVSEATLPVLTGSEIDLQSGAHTGRVLHTLREIDSLFVDDYGRTVNVRTANGDSARIPMFVSDTTTWAQVDAFYRDAFARPPLAAAGFTRQPVASAHPDRYRLAVWARPRGPFRRDEALGVALVFGRPSSPDPFVLRFHAPGNLRD